MKFPAKPPTDHRRRFLATAAIACLWQSGCASPMRTPAASRNSSLWIGRLALQVESEPPQAFHASFELSGEPDAGELRLTSPLGNALALVRWTPKGATLTQGGRVSEHASVDDLASALGGAPLPVTALFDWLQARDANVPGWEADLSRSGDGRISARRTFPAPPASLRIVLDP